MPEIELYDGPREALRHLFSEADDSEHQIIGYMNLGELLVFRDDAKLIGHAQIVELPDAGSFELKSLAVDERYRSRGIGSALVQAAIRRCRDRGAHLVLVATAAASIPALKFYQRQGFRISHVIRDFYSAERGYRPLELDGIPLLDEVILDLRL